MGVKGYAPSVARDTRAHALAHEVDNERAGVSSPSMIDTAHLERLGVLGKVAEWRRRGREISNLEAG